jgi:hypothetical protein
VNDRNLFIYLFDGKEEEFFLQRKMVYFDKRRTIGIFYDKEEVKKI